MTDQLSFLPMLGDAEHPTWLLNGKHGVQNDSGVYVENVLRFREGKLSGVNIGVDLCAEGDYILFEFDYFTGTYGCGHPLCRLTFKNPKIRIGTGKPEWGAEPGKNYFVITWEE